MQPKVIRIGLGLALAILLAGGGFVVGRQAQTGAARTLRLDQLENIYGLLQRKYDGELNLDQLIEGAKQGFVAATGDPYTAYLTKDEAKRLQDDLKGDLSGIGAEIGIKQERLSIIAPLPDSPAQAAGLRAGDQIRAIDDVDTTGMSVEEAVSKIRGEAGTEVKLLIGRGGASPQTVTIKRALIQVKSVKWELKPGQVGYLQISRFGDDTLSLLNQAAADLKRQGARSYILDLRNNPGGYLQTSVDVAGLFMSNKVVVEERRVKGRNKQLRSSGGAELEGAKLIVLVNAGSASASEIVAGALQDHKAAQVLGERSFGKGSVQEIIDLSSGAQLKVTIAHWYTPQGRSIDHEGIKPDIEVKLETADYDAGRDPQLERALQLLAQ
jgi:carboxyl-terminal processing protease